MAMCLLAASGCGLKAQGQPTEWNTPGAGNPILPGYFADPTIRKFGDTFYIYATTDGTGNGYGPAQVWVSKDFVNWQNVLLNWPTTEVVWAPDVVQQPDGSYRYYYCTPCQVYVGESQSPLGPWKNRLGDAEAVLVPDRFVHNAITLDPMLFRDDDGSEYLYFGTWGIYKDFGCGVTKLAADGKSFTDKRLILNTEITDFFEAPFVFKKDGVYYFTYSSGSCHDETYRVQYATSTVGPMGPYEYRGCILTTNADGTIHGPGHHSILMDDEDYYIVYHRHNNPHSIHGFHRQLCIDRLEFDARGNILPVKAGHEGVIPSSMQKNAKRYEGKNLAFGKVVTASSRYSDWFKPEYAVDDNNGTLWRAANCHEQAWLQIDFGQPTHFNQVFTQFEYATFFYQYRLETSLDGENWKVYADKTENRYAGSPMVDVGEETARYLRLTITDTQHNGHFPAVWNMKVYEAKGKFNPLKALPNPTIDEQALLAGYPDIRKKDLEDNPAEHREALFSLDASDYDLGERVNGVPVVPQKEKAAFRFSGHGMTLDASPLRTLKYNSPYTITAWVLNPATSGVETICQLNGSQSDLATVQLRNSEGLDDGIVAHNASMENAGATEVLRAGEWQHWVLTFDGFMERIYCDGHEVSAKNIFLMLQPSETFSIGEDMQHSNPFTGYLHSLKIYDRAFSPADVMADLSNPTQIDSAKLQSENAGRVLRNEKLHLACVYRSDNLAEIYVAGSNGKALEGVYDFQFTASGDEVAFEKAAWTDDNRMVVSVAESPKDKERGGRFMARVRDMYGYCVTVKEVRNAPKDFKSEMIASPILAKADKRGCITLESQDRNLNSDPLQNGPIEAVEVTGDFIAQCHIADMTGMNRHQTPGYNEGGLIIVDTLPNGTQNLIQLGVFPNYNCGNMLTTVINGWRPQYQNRLGWDFDPWLQLERKGDTVYVRTSKDGIVWQEMQHSPVEYRFAEGRPVRVGIFQTTYTSARASMTFDAIKIWKIVR